MKKAPRPRVRPGARRHPPVASPSLEKEVSTRTFLEIARRHHAHIFHLVHSLVKNVHASEEITRTTFGRVRERLERAGGAPSTLWIYYTALNLARRHYLGTFRPVLGRAADSSRLRLADATANQEDSVPCVGVREFAAMLARNMGHIDSGDQELLALRHVVGLSIDEISRVLGLRPDAVTERVRRSHDSMHPFAIRP